MLMKPRECWRGAPAFLRATAVYFARQQLAVVDGGLHHSVWQWSTPCD